MRVWLLNIDEQPIRECFNSQDEINNYIAISLTDRMRKDIYCCLEAFTIEIPDDTPDDEKYLAALKYLRIKQDEIDEQLKAIIWE